MEYTPLSKSSSQAWAVIKEIDKFIDLYPQQKLPAIESKKFEILLKDIDVSKRHSYANQIPYRGRVIRRAGK